MTDILTDQQEIFDTVVRHLFTQGKMSMRYNRTSSPCAYRGNNGLTCAIGCLIPDDRYHHSMEGQSSFALTRPVYIPEWRGIVAFLTALQRIHDTRDYWYDTETMRVALRLVAKDFGLTDDIVDTLSFKNR